MSLVDGRRVGQVVPSKGGWQDKLSLVDSGWVRWVALVDSRWAGWVVPSRQWGKGLVVPRQQGVGASCP